MYMDFRSLSFTDVAARPNFVTEVESGKHENPTMFSYAGWQFCVKSLNLMYGT